MFHNVLMTSLTPLRNTNETSQCWQNRPFVGIWPEEYQRRDIKLPIRKKRRHRTNFTTDQLLELEGYYAQHRYVTALERAQLATKMNLSTRSIKVWFQNRRMKEKKINDTYSSNESSSEITSSVVSPAPFYRISSPEEYTPNSYNYQTPDFVDNQSHIPNTEANVEPVPYQLPIENFLQQPKSEVLGSPNIPVNQDFIEDYNLYPTSYYPAEYYYYSNVNYDNGVSSSSDHHWPINNNELNYLQML